MSGSRDGVGSAEESRSRRRSWNRFRKSVRLHGGKVLLLLLLLLLHGECVMLRRGRLEIGGILRSDRRVGMMLLLLRMLMMKDSIHPIAQIRHG